MKESQKMRVAVFASGNGSNFQMLADRAREGSLAIDVVLLVSDKPACGAVERARTMDIPVFLAPRKDYESRKAMEEAIGRALTECGAELVVLAGYMRILGPELVSAWRHKMINLHPSLLPSFTGLDALGQALEAGVKVTGATVHIVDEGLDTGPIVAQRAFPVPEGIPRADLEETLHAVEHEMLGEVVALFAAGRVECDGQKVRILPASSSKSTPERSLES